MSGANLRRSRPAAPVFSPLPNVDVAHRLVLGPLYDAALERSAAGGPRFPDIDLLVRRAVGPELLLERYVAELDKEANRAGHDEAWKSYALSRLFTAWEKVGPSATKKRSGASKALTDRRRKIAEGAHTLKKELLKNEAMAPREVAADLRAFPVTVRFPGLLPMLDEVVAWSERANGRAPQEAQSPGPVRFHDAVGKALGFHPTWPCLADLWNLFANDPDHEMTDDKIRIACSREARKRTDGA